MDGNRDVIKATVKDAISEQASTAETKAPEFIDLFSASQRPGSAVRLSGGSKQPLSQYSEVVGEPLEVVERPVVHAISSPISVTLSGSASAQKSFACEFSTGFMQQSKNAPPCTTGGDAFMVESSAQGIRTCILNHDRCSATSDEIVNTFPTP